MTCEDTWHSLYVCIFKKLRGSGTSHPRSRQDEAAFFFVTFLLLATCNLAHGKRTSRHKNPLYGRRFFKPPSFQQDIQSSVRTARRGKELRHLSIIRDIPTAYWLDVKYKVVAGDDKTTDTAEGILKHASRKYKSPLVTFVVYDLPNRDCSAEASNGEICSAEKRLPNGKCDFVTTNVITSISLPRA